MQQEIVNIHSAIHLYLQRTITPAHVLCYASRAKTVNCWQWLH